MGKKGKRKYTMSAAALDQRRAAPWKHGERGRSLLTQTSHPCKPGLCPLADPELKGNCDIKRAMAKEEKNIEACPVSRVTNEATRKKIEAAIRGGDLEAMAELYSGLLAGMFELGASELKGLLENGFSFESVVMDPTGNLPVGSQLKVNPAAEPFLKLMDLLGATGAAQVITPKSRGEKKTGESVDELVAMLAGRAAKRDDRALPAPRGED